MAEKQRIARLLHTTLPGAILLFALVFAPWFWGCTWPLGIHLLTLLLLAAVAMWAAGLLLRSKVLSLPPLLVAAALGLLAQGWGMTLNAHSVCDEESGALLPIAGYVDGLPGSLDRDRSREDMPRLSALLGAGVISAWLGRSLAWRRRFLWTLTATGLSIVLLGCGQRWTGATDIFWNPARHLDFFFATYRNVTNAGEYLNLILPLAASLTLAAAVKRQGPVRLAFGALAVVVLATGSLICGSRMAPVAACFSAALFIAMQWGFLRAHASRSSGRISAMTLLIVAVLLAVVVQSAGPGVTWERWGRLVHDPNGGATWTNRLLVDRVCLLAAPDAGVFGFGPGTFRSIFPYYTDRVDGDLSGVWTYAHNDYAQTWLEWGAFGETLGALYFFGGVVTLARGWRRSAWATEDRICAAALLQALVLVALLAAVDFPLQIASIQITVAILVGLAWSSPHWPRRRLEDRKISLEFGETKKIIAAK